MPRLGPYFWGLAPGHLHLRVLPFFRFAFIAAHAVGQRAVIWYSSWRYFPIFTAPKVNHLAVVLIGFLPLCLPYSFLQWRRLFRPALSLASFAL